MLRIKGEKGQNDREPQNIDKDHQEYRKKVFFHAPIIRSGRVYCVLFFLAP